MVTVIMDSASVAPVGGVAVFAAITLSVYSVGPSSLSRPEPFWSRS